MDKNKNTISATLASEICNQISSIFSKPSSTPSPLTLLVNEISSVSQRKGKIFVYGVGREGLMLKALCMRLFHLGLSAHCVFDMTTPPISASDLLIASAGPGGFSTVNAICRVAKENGAVVLLLTAEVEEAVRVGVASVVAHVPARTMADDQVHVTSETREPRGKVHSGETSLASIVPHTSMGNDDDDRGGDGDGDGDGDGEGGGGGELLPMGSLYEGALFVLFEMVVFELGKVLKQGCGSVTSHQLGVIRL